MASHRAPRRGARRALRDWWTNTPREAPVGAAPRSRYRVASRPVRVHYPDHRPPVTALVSHMGTAIEEGGQERAYLKVDVPADTQLVDGMVVKAGPSEHAIVHLPIGNISNYF